MFTFHTVKSLKVKQKITSKSLHELFKSKINWKLATFILFACDTCQHVARWTCLSYVTYCTLTDVFNDIKGLADFKLLYRSMDVDDPPFITSWVTMRGRYITRDVLLKNKVWERTQKLPIFNSTSNSLLKQYFVKYFFRYTTNKNIHSLPQPEIFRSGTPESVCMTGALAPALS